MDVREQGKVIASEKLNGECPELLQGPQAAGQALLAKSFALITYPY